MTEDIDRILSRIQDKLTVALMEADFLPESPERKLGIKQGLTYAISKIKEERERIRALEVKA